MCFVCEVLCGVVWYVCCLWLFLFVCARLVDVFVCLFMMCCVVMYGLTDLCSVVWSCSFVPV